MTNKAKAAGRATQAAFKTASKRTHHSASAANEQSGKAVAVWVTASAVEALRKRDGKFDTSPVWRPSMNAPAEASAA